LRRRYHRGALANFDPDVCVHGDDVLLLGAGGVVRADVQDVALNIDIEDPGVLDLAPSRASRSRLTYPDA
jgi:shikimate 5-dehydrogenase